MFIIDDGQTHVVSTHVADSYIVRNGTLEVTTGGSIIAPAGAAAIEMIATGTATVTITGGQVRGGDGSASGGAGIVMNAMSGTNVLTVSDGLVSGGFGTTSGGPALMTVNDSPGASNRATITGGSVLGGGGETSAGNGIYVINGCDVMVSGGTIGSPNGVTIAVTQQDPSLPAPSVAISGSTILGDTTILLQVAQYAAGITVSGGTFNTPWDLVSGQLVVQGTGLVLADGNLTGTLASGEAIDVAVNVQANARVILLSS